MKLKGFIIVCMLGFFFTYTVQATTVAYKTFNELIDESQYVIGGIIEKINSKRYRNNQVFSVITIKNAYTITSTGIIPIERKVIIRYAGGEVRLLNKDGNAKGTEAVFAHGTPEFNQKDEVILFISHNGTASMPIYGWGQGVFRINKDGGVLAEDRAPVVAINGADIVTRNAEGLWARGKLLHRKNFHTKTTEQPSIIDSEGGSDLIESDQASQIDNDGILDENSRLFQSETMDIHEFESMIQERKAETENAKIEKGFAPVEPDLSSLITLSDLNTDGSSPDHALNSKEYPTSNPKDTIDLIDSTPQIPLSEPDVEQDGH